jgi:subtilase family serine protease
MIQGRFGWLMVVGLAAIAAVPALLHAEEVPSDAVETAAQMRSGVTLDVPPGAEIGILETDPAAAIGSSPEGGVPTSPADAQTDVTLCSETFEGQFPGNSSCNWVVRYCGQGYTWDEDLCRASTGAYAAWCANGRYTNQAGFNPCTTSYPNDLCSFMIAGPYNLSDASAATVQYDFWLRAQGGYQDFLYVGYSTDGTSFTNGDQFTGDYGDTWNRDRTLSLQSVVGRPQVWIGFAFFTDSWGQFNSLPNGAFLDNIRITKSTGSAPDLIVTSLGFDNSTCPTQVRAMVRNQGNANCGANTCRFWRGQTQLSDVGIRALAAGEEDWSGWSPLGSYTPGDYSIRGCADIAGQIQEIDETNNCLTTNYTGWCVSADLTVTALGFDNAACPTQVRAKVKNLGGATAGASSCRFWMDDVLKGNATIRSLAAGEEDWSGWCPIGSPTGNHSVRSCVDPDGSIAEGNENNNCLTVDYTSWCQTPDLRVATLQFDPANCATRMRAEVRNSGTAAAGASVCRFTVDSVQKCDVNVAGIAAGGSIWTDWCPIGQSVPQTRLGGACADVNNAVVEGNESNNCLSQNFGCSSNQFYIPSGIEFAAGAGAVEIPIYAQNTDPLTAFSVSICLDPAVFEILGVTVAGTRAQGATQLVDSVPENGCISVALVYSYGCPVSIPAGDGAVMKLLLTVLPDAPVGPTAISFTDRPPAGNRMTLCDFSTVIPGFGSSTVDILANGFVRGDFDASGSLNIADALAGLHYVSRDGTAPPCQDAADLNDDGVIDVSDAVYSLGFQFGDGDQPPAPYPTCGDDPTADNLGCVSFAGCAPNAGARAGAPSKAHSAPAIEVAAIYSAGGDSLYVPMTLDVESSAAAFDIEVTFDSAVVTYAGLARTGAAVGFDFCGARLLPGDAAVRVGEVVDLGLQSSLPTGRHGVGTLVFLIRERAALEGSMIEVHDGLLVDDSGAATPLADAALSLTTFEPTSPPDFSIRLSNPYRPGLPITIELRAQAPVRLAVYNVHGQKVRELVSAALGAGRQEIRWDGRGNGGELAGTGVYYLSGVIAERSVHRKLLLIR